MIGLSKLADTPAVAQSVRALSLARTLRNAGEHETGVLVAQAQGKEVFAGGDVDIAALGTDGLAMNMSIYESLDDGQIWKFACGMTDVGAVGRTHQPFISLSDPNIGGRRFKAVLSIDAQAQAGAVVEVR